MKHIMGIFFPATAKKKSTLTLYAVNSFKLADIDTQMHLYHLLGMNEKAPFGGWRDLYVNIFVMCN